MPASSLLSDADLHGLVDGHIDADRRADVLRRAAASPRDRALIETWQDQADLIRAAFAGIEREPLPSSLDLRAPPRLHAVPLLASPPQAVARRRTWRRSLGAAATTVAVGIGLAGSWYVAGLPAAGLRTPGLPTPGEERMLVDRTVAALAFGEADAPFQVATAEPPTTTAIPDLSNAGFTFTGAEARGVSPKSLIFRYRNADGERVAIGAARTQGDDSSPVPRDNGFTWRNGRVVYSVFGTVASERLGAIAGALHADMRRDQVRP